MPVEPAAASRNGEDQEDEDGEDRPVGAGGDPIGRAPLPPGRGPTHGPARSVANLLQIRRIGGWFAPNLGDSEKRWVDAPNLRKIRFAAKGRGSVPGGRGRWVGGPGRQGIVGTRRRHRPPSGAGTRRAGVEQGWRITPRRRRRLSSSGRRAACPAGGGRSRMVARGDHRGENAASEVSTSTPRTRASSTRKASISFERGPRPRGDPAGPRGLGNPHHEAHASMSRAARVADGAVVVVDRGGPSSARAGGKTSGPIAGGEDETARSEDRRRGRG